LKISRLSAISERQFDVGKPSAYPDELLEVPFANAVSQLILKTEIGVLESARDFALGVHIGEGVSLPAVFNYKISANLRFLFKEKLDRDYQFNHTMNLPNVYVGNSTGGHVSVKTKRQNGTRNWYLVSQNL
jgi:hypothetical protein